mgnify:CR=1 FL=1
MENSCLPEVALLVSVASDNINNRLGSLAIKTEVSPLSLKKVGINRFRDSNNCRPLLPWQGKDETDLKELIVDGLNS